MAYSQNNYPQTQGINGRYTIAQIGCFVTAFCNLEADFGITVDPGTLNNFFRDHNLYWDVDDGIRDDVDWHFVNLYDNNTVVSGRGSGWPNTNQAIVKFSYVSPNTRQRTTHFCKVHDANARQILDSWDGRIKHISETVYGEPVEYATYEHKNAVVAQPAYTRQDIPARHLMLNKNTFKYDCNRTDFEDRRVNNLGGYSQRFDFWSSVKYITQEGNTYYSPDPLNSGGFHEGDVEDYREYAPPKAPEPIKLAEKYELIMTVMYFKTAEDAKKRINAVSTVNKGTYYLIKTDEQAVLLSKDNKTDIGWVNTFDNKIEKPKPDLQPSNPIPAPVTEKPVVVTLPVDVADNSKPQPDHIAPRPQYYPINNDLNTVRITSLNTKPYPIFDVEGKYAGTDLPARRTEDYRMFVEIDGSQYYIIERCRQKGMNYGVPVDLLRQSRIEDVFDRNDDGKLNIHDVSDGIQDFIDYSSKYFTGLMDVVKPLAPKLTETKKRITRAVDGFSSRRPKQ